MDLSNVQENCINLVIEQMYREEKWGSSREEIMHNAHKILGRLMIDSGICSYVPKATIKDMTCLSLNCDTVRGSKTINLDLSRVKNSNTKEAYLEQIVKKTEDCLNYVYDETHLQNLRVEFISSWWGVFETKSISFIESNCFPDGWGTSLTEEYKAICLKRIISGCADNYPDNEL